MCLAVVVYLLWGSERPLLLLFCCCLCSSKTAQRKATLVNVTQYRILYVQYV
jgi:hypothetical protein